MELGISLDLNSFIGNADNPERRLYRTWPLFHICFGDIINFFKKFYPFICLNKYIAFKFHLFILCHKEGKVLVFRFHPLLMQRTLPPYTEPNGNLSQIIHPLHFMS